MPSTEETIRYWDDDPSDNAFMEITQRPDIGGDLRAPRLGRDGHLTASYRLVLDVKPGSVVVHYDSRGGQEAIVGVSLAIGPPEPAAIYWAARGSYARRARVRPSWLPGVRVPLDGFARLDPPITLAELRTFQSQIMAIRGELERRHGPPVYFPWVPYAGGSGPMRTFQAYLAKLPARVIDLIPRLRQAVTSAAGRTSPAPPSSEIDWTVAAVDRAAGRREGRRMGQGFQSEQAVKVAVEAHAMNAATACFGGSWEVIDVHGSESFDLKCIKGGEEKHIEVKGTTTLGQEVILTPNEVEHARSHPDTALFVLTQIDIERTKDGGVRASGGVPIVLDPWIIAQGVLRPVGFRYQLPGPRER
jgi:Protein NO VEIN, C-terminal